MSQDSSERVQCGRGNNVADRDDANGDRAALSVLRGIWAARGHSATELGATELGATEPGATEPGAGWVSNAKVCKNSAALGLPEVDDDLRAAWRARLAREGKLVSGATSVAHLVPGAAEPGARGAAG